MRRFWKRLVVLTAIMALSACNLFPWMESRLLLPDGTVIRVMTRAGGASRTSVENSHGEVSRSNFMPVGNRRTGLYLTPENYLVTIDNGGDLMVFTLGSTAKPDDITSAYSRLKTTNSAAWKYLGVVERGDNDLHYYPPKLARECIALYGEGHSPYRKAFQAQHFCGP